MALSPDSCYVYMYPSNVKFTLMLEDDLTYTEKDGYITTYNSKECLCLLLDGVVGADFIMKFAFHENSTLYYISGTWASGRSIYLNASEIIKPSITTPKLYAYKTNTEEFDTIYATTDSKTAVIDKWYNKYGKEITNCVYDLSGTLLDDSVSLKFTDTAGVETHTYTASPMLRITNANLGGPFDLYINNNFIETIGPVPELAKNPEGNLFGIWEYRHPISTGDIIRIDGTEEPNTSRVLYTITNGTDAATDEILGGALVNYQEHSYTVKGDVSINVTGVYICCVPGYSKILYSDNTTKPAEDVKVGDKLLGYNVSQKNFCEVEVYNIIQKQRVELVKITLDNNIILEVTPDHPIYTNQGWACYNPDESTYKSASDIEKLIILTDELSVLTSDGKFHKISNIEYSKLDTEITTYTFNTTTGIDTFIAENCVVHNACEPW